MSQDFVIPLHLSSWPDSPIRFVRACWVMLLYCWPLPNQTADYSSGHIHNHTKLKRGIWNESLQFTLFVRVLLHFPRFPSLFLCLSPCLPLLFLPCLLITALCLVSLVEGLLWPIRLPSHRQMNGEMTAERGGGGEQEARMKKGPA